LGRLFRGQVISASFNEFSGQDDGHSQIGEHQTELTLVVLFIIQLSRPDAINR